MGVRKKRPKDALHEKIDLWAFPGPDKVEAYVCIKILCLTNIIQVRGTLSNNQCDISALALAHLCKIII